MSGPTLGRSRMSAPGRAVHGSLPDQTSSPDITGNIQVGIRICLPSPAWPLSIVTGQKPFKCHLCGRQFSRSDHLSLHMKRHWGRTWAWAWQKGCEAGAIITRHQFWESMQYFLNLPVVPTWNSYSSDK